MDLKMMSALELAFVGDAAYELQVRRRIAEKVNTSPNELHKMCVAYVRAEAQHAAYIKILPMLSEEEQTVARRGRNSSKTTVPKNASAAEYRDATALEAVFGYLYLLGREERAEELMNCIFSE